MGKYAYEPFDYVTPGELRGSPSQAPVAIIGAGPIGLALAIDLAQSGVASVVLDDNNVVSVGSRAICWAKRTLEIFDRLGVGERMLRKGVTWQVGRQFHGQDEVYAFDLLPEAGHKFPAFINLQQYYVEQYLVERAREFPDLIELRFKNRVTDHTDHGDHVSLQVETPDGAYRLKAQYLIACDGAGSATRTRMDLPFTGQTFDEQFLIVDIHMEESPFGDKSVPERWFWFDPPFHGGKSALLHQQPDDIYRIDLQLDAGIDGKREADPERVKPRIRQMIGDKPFEIDWLSVYTFRCMTLDRYLHDRVIFAGDSAHVVSPFGARGGNGGIQDIDNLGWKLAAVIKGEAPAQLLETYDTERRHGADENLRMSAQATNFMTPKSPMEAMFRAEALRLAHDLPFAQKLINSGRLSLPCQLDESPLHTPGACTRPVGSVVIDAPFGGSWLIEELQGEFILFGLGNIDMPDIEGVRSLRIDKPDAITEARYGTDCAYLIRPDGHIAASFQEAERLPIELAVRRARGERL